MPERRDKTREELERWHNLPTRSKRLWKSWHVRDMSDPRYAPGPVIIRKAPTKET